MLKIPVIVGSGVTAANVQDFIDADMLIVGSAFKHNNHWAGNLMLAKIKEVFEKMKEYQ